MNTLIKTDGIIFDMDGTIWDNTEVFAKSWTKAAKDHGYDIVFTKEILKKLFGRTMKEIADLSIPDDNPDNRYSTLKDCEIYEMKDLLDNNIDTTYEGLEDVLKDLSKKIKLFIVSNCQSGYIEGYFKITNHNKYFTDYICYGDNGLGKADNIKLIIDKYKLKNPMYIGDIQADKDACVKANCGFIRASYGYGDNIDSYDAKIEKITDLINIIKGE